MCLGAVLAAEVFLSRYEQAKRLPLCLILDILATLMFCSRGRQFLLSLSLQYPRSHRLNNQSCSSSRSLSIQSLMSSFSRQLASLTGALAPQVSSGPDLSISEYGHFLQQIHLVPPKCDSQVACQVLHNY